MSSSFGVTWDYRCPFARNAHEHLVTGLQHGADWDVRFLVFSLEQTHVEEGGTPVWEEPDRHPGLVANLAGVVVRDRCTGEISGRPCRALFAARHDQALDLRDPASRRQSPRLGGCRWGRRSLARSRRDGPWRY